MWLPVERKRIPDTVMLPIDSDGQYNIGTSRL